MATTQPCGATPLVVLPGTLCDRRMFAPLLERLDLCDRTIAHLSFDGARSIDTAVAQILSAMPQRAILLGFSLGGIVALAVAKAAPDRVAGLILIGSTPRPVDPDQHGVRRAEVARARAEGLQVYVWTSLLQRYFADPTERRHDALLLDMATDVDRFENETALALSRGDARTWLGDLDMPVLIAGGKSDRINPPTVQIEMAAALPDATLVLLANAGHFTPLEQPKALASHVATWLARVDGHVFSQTKEEQR